MGVPSCFILLGTAANGAGGSFPGLRGPAFGLFIPEPLKPWLPLRTINKKEQKTRGRERHRTQGGRASTSVVELGGPCPCLRRPPCPSGPGSPSSSVLVLCLPPAWAGAHTACLAPGSLPSLSQPGPACPTNTPRLSRSYALHTAVFFADYEHLHPTSSRKSSRTMSLSLTLEARSLSSVGLCLWALSSPWCLPGCMLPGETSSHLAIQHLTPRAESKAPGVRKRGHMFMRHDCMGLPQFPQSWETCWTCQPQGPSAYHSLIVVPELLPAGDSVH